MTANTKRKLAKKTAKHFISMYKNSYIERESLEQYLRFLMAIEIEASFIEKTKDTKLPLNRIYNNY